MASGLPLRFLGFAQLGRLLVILLALASQVSAGARADPSSESASAVLRAAMILCLAGNHSPPTRHHHLPDLAIVAKAHHAVPHAATLDAGWALPSPTAGPASRSSLPPARGPPARYAAAAYPTGPPVHLL